MIKTLRRSFIALIFLASLAVAVPAYAASASFSLSPSSGSYKTGDTVNVTIDEDSGSETVSTIEADLQYPANVLQYSSVDASSSAFTDVAPAPSASNGVVSMSRASIAGQMGKQTVIVVKFKAIADGNATFSMASSSAIFRLSDAANIYSASTTAGAAGTTQPAGVTNSSQATASQQGSGSSTSSSSATPSTSSTGTKASPTPTLVQIITSQSKALKAKPASHTGQWLVLLLILLVLGFFAGRLWWHRHKQNHSIQEPPVPPVEPAPPTSTAI